MKDRRRQKRKTAKMAKFREKVRRRKLVAEYRSKIADKKARELVMDLLPEDQREVYEKTGRLLVKGNSYDWLIKKRGRSVSIKKLTKDKVVDLCVYHTKGDLPADDRVVGFALAAKYSEEHLEKTANYQGSRNRDDFIQHDLKEAACI
jgi:hypothetical protein